MRKAATGGGTMTGREAQQWRLGTKAKDEVDGGRGCTLEEVRARPDIMVSVSGGEKGRGTGPHHPQCK